MAVLVFFEGVLVCSFSLSFSYSTSAEVALVATAFLRPRLRGVGVADASVVGCIVLALTVSTRRGCIAKIYTHSTCAYVPPGHCQHYLLCPS